MAMLKHSVFLLKQGLANRDALRLRDRLEAEERLSADELAERAWHKMRSLVRFAWESTPFYRRFYGAAGFLPGDLRQREDWQGLPVLTKQHLRESFPELVARPVRRRWQRVSSTGGSTGEPVKVLFDTRVRLEAFAWRMLDWWGRFPSDDIAFVFRRTQGRGGRLLNHLLWWPTRRLFLDAGAMSTPAVDRFLRHMKRTRPAILQGYTGALADVAEELERRGLRPDHLKAVWCTSAPLPDSQRRLLERAFGAPAYDQYGCGEVFWVAAECRLRQGLHVFHASRHIDVVDEDERPCAPGTPGDLLVSDLENRVFPILRYRNGDQGSTLPHHCPCGLPLPLIANVKGRISDSLRLPGGRTIAGDYLTTIFDSCPEAVRAFQVRQLLDQSIVLRCVPGDGAHARRQVEAVALGLRHCVAGCVPVRLELVERIAHDRGKTRFIVRETEEGR
ncbi:MAG: hypothetical protein Q8O14_12610 [bacterium]|nr:hypothetical protein [bacterium]